MLKDRVAVITGSGRGIGRGIAFKLSEKGASIVVNDKDKQAVDDTVKALVEKGGTAVGVVADISTKNGVERLMDTAVRELGRLDILVNNAGEFQGASLEEMTEEQWDSVVDVDLKGAFFCTQAASKYMREIKYGRVINVSSANALVGEIGMANYIAAKCGLFGLTACIAREFSRWNKAEACVMTCNCIIVGYSPTRLTEEIWPADMRNSHATEIPLGKPLDPKEDIGSTVAFLASEKASYITGTKIPVAGGLYATLTTYG